MTERTRLIDEWFPIDAVDEACRTPTGSGLTEKALSVWFASRPIAQARAAVMTALLPAGATHRKDVVNAVQHGSRAAHDRLTRAVRDNYNGRSPTVLDMFSGRAIIPLEAARLGANAVGLDLSPFATFGGRLLADFPARDWSQEPPIPFGNGGSGTGQVAMAEISASDHGPSRLVDDVTAVLSEVDFRVKQRMRQHYPLGPTGSHPWAYFWAVTMPCDRCKRRFPLIGSLWLRYPSIRQNVSAQSLHLSVSGNSWRAVISDSPPAQEPTYGSASRSDGAKRKGKSAKCLFCGHTHPLETVKAIGFANGLEDALLAVADTADSGLRTFRSPTDDDQSAIAALSLDRNVRHGPYSMIPDEVIPEGNVHTIMASGYGYKTFGDLMCVRQTLYYSGILEELSRISDDLSVHKFSDHYRASLIAYAASTLCKQLRRSSRGARLLLEGAPDGSKSSVVRVSDLFANQASVNFQLDFLEIGLGTGAGTWSSVASSTVQSLRKVLREHRGPAARIEGASATALPMRSNSVDAVITDPPYYDMIEYADASDFLYVWVKRAMYREMPELFGVASQQRDGLQDKNQEIIVRRVHEPARVVHDRDFYEAMLAKAFGETRRVLRDDGCLVVVFGHSDPDAWKHLLGALQTAGFIITSSWPSRTESGAGGVASIKVTVTIGCRVAPTDRPDGLARDVDLEAQAAVADAARAWDAGGLALEDQLMASYGPAMAVFGKYKRVVTLDGNVAALDRYLNLARRTVRDTMRLKVDDLPLDSFDAFSRLALFWLRAKGRTVVPKSEALFFAQSDDLRIADLKRSILAESAAGFTLRLDDPGEPRRDMSAIEVVRAMVALWEREGTDGAARALSWAGREPSDAYVWAIVADVATRVPAADQIGRALAALKRNENAIRARVDSFVPPGPDPRATTTQLTLGFEPSALR